MACEVQKAKIRQAALLVAQNIARASQLKIDFSDVETVIAISQR